MNTGFIGAGNMGGAILSGYAEAQGMQGEGILLCDKNEELCERRRTAFPKLKLCTDNASLCEQSDIVVIGVKPQVIGSVLEEISGKCGDGRLVISMAAGISIDTLESYLGSETQILRIMPNTPAMVGEAMVAVCRNQSVTDERYSQAMDIFAAVGRAEEVDESLMDCIIGVSGSSPAYTYMYIEALVDAAEANGMTRDKARVFAAQSVLGAAKMVLESEDSLEQLRINVCSPKGTTIEAVEKLQENGFSNDVKEGFQAAVDRSIEMTREAMQ